MMSVNYAQRKFLPALLAPDTVQKIPSNDKLAILFSHHRAVMLLAQALSQVLVFAARNRTATMELTLD